MRAVRGREREGGGEREGRGTEIVAVPNKSSEEVVITKRKT